MHYSRSKCLMGGINRGKQFEQKFRENCQQIAGMSIDRLPDQFNGLKNSSNICDFVCYRYPSLAYVEVKSCYGNTFPLHNLAQYERLLGKKGIKGVHPTVVVWFIDHDKVIAFPITSIEQMYKDNLKSINVKTYAEYSHVDIPSKKRRVLMDSDYTILFDNFKKEDMEVDING